MMFIALRAAVRARRPEFSNWNDRVCVMIIFVIATPMIARIVSAVRISTSEKPLRRRRLVFIMAPKRSSWRTASGSAG